MSEAKKVVVVGDTVYLLTIENKIIEYKILNAGIAIHPETGNYQCGFWLDNNENESGDFFQPYYVILELMNLGYLWKKGSEEIAANLRRIHELKKKGNSNETQAN